ncbi:MAG: IclR family transcriptional regulator [Betaproteobacteria bacterium]|nr:IclR family transcriptional regulator [Betaproteobacteria bacterium]
MKKTIPAAGKALPLHATRTTRPRASRAPKVAKARQASAGNDRQFITALARGLQVLRCFHASERYLGNLEFAARTGLPKPTISRLTHTLTGLGYLDYSPAFGKYSLGAAVLSLSYPYLASLDVRDVARPLMHELAEYAQATVSLGARDGLHMIYLEICQGSQMFRMHMAVGSRVPHGTTAMGRAYLATLAQAQRAEIIEQYREITPKQEWPKVHAGIEQAIEDYAQYGFCLSLGEWNPDVWAVGTPMASSDGSRILAFNVSGPVFNMTRARLISDIGPRLCDLRDRVLSATGGNF